MKFSRLLLLCALCLSAVCCFSLDRNAFTFTDYDLKVQIEPEQQRLGVRGKITLRNDSGVAQKTAVLQISSSLDWRSIKVDGEPVQFVSQTYTSDIDHTGALSEAVVNLPKEIPARGSVEIEIGYEGVVLLDATRLTRIGVPEEKARHSDWDQISAMSTAVRGIGYVTWYPVATEAASLSDGTAVFDTVGAWKFREQASRMQLSACSTAPTGQTLLAVLFNNVRAGDVGGGGMGGPVGGPTSTCGVYTYSHLGLAVPTFVTGSLSRSDAPPVSVYALSKHARNAAVFTDSVQSVEAFVHEWFGQWKHSSQVVDLPDPEAAPFDSGSMLLVPLERSEPKLAGTLIAHQLTHAAFDSPRPWIAEGLAHFAQALWIEQQSGRQAALDLMGLHRTSLAAAEKAAGEQKNSGATQSLITTTDEEYYRSKAMFVWWMLRDMVGDTAFQKAIAAYEPERDTQPSYVQKLFQKQSHRDLEWFFDDWVYRDRGLPDFRVASAYSRQILSGTYMVTVTVENLGSAGAEVPIRLRFEGGDVSSKVEVRGKSSASVRVEVPSPAREVTVNDGSVPESDMENNTFGIQESRK
jgi:hypothetical protein